MTNALLIKVPKSHQMLTPEEVAQLLRISVSTLRIWRKNPYSGPRWVEVGGNIRYRLADVERYLSENTRV